jgi:hypothetical protein
MFELKVLSREGVENALHKAERYRLLNEAWQAESICRDVLRIEPENQSALTALILALTDQFRIEGSGHPEEARTLLERLTSEYARCYYAGIICERRGMAYLNRNAPGSGYLAWDWLRQAMQWYEKAEALRAPGSEDALLRWNTCARVMNSRDDVRPAPESDLPEQLE